MADDRTCTLIQHIYPRLCQCLRKNIDLRYILHETNEGYAYEIVNLIDTVMRVKYYKALWETDTTLEYVSLLRSVLNGSMQGNRGIRLHEERYLQLLDDSRRWITT
jgi:hypothetical protein